MMKEEEMSDGLGKIKDEIEETKAELVQMNQRNHETNVQLQRIADALERQA